MNIKQKNKVTKEKNKLENFLTIKYTTSKTPLPTYINEFPNQYPQIVEQLNQKYVLSPVLSPIKQHAGNKLIKDSFERLIKKAIKVIDDNLEPVEENIPLEKGELHFKKLINRNGTIQYQNTNFCGPGTKIEEKIAKKN